MKIDPRIKVFGDKKLRMKKPPSENAEQITIFNHLRLHYPEIAALAAHVKNEGKKSQGEAQKDAQMGLNPGFSDIIIIGNPVFVCELKKRDFTKSRISDDQQEFLLASQDAGAFACVALGALGFFDALEEWKNAQR
jgi:hypothetical protein